MSTTHLISAPMNSSKAPLWMSLDELSNSADFEARIVDEFPQGASVWNNGLSRRKFLQLMGASIALAGLNGCMRLPEQKIIPYTQQPEKLVPGRPLHFATTIRVNGSPRGVLVTQNEGRPTHIAGNPLHPMSLGASDVWTTASLLDLYDPDRLQSVLHGGSVSSWDDFSQAYLALYGDLLKSGGEGFCLLTSPLHSPTELRLMQQILTKFPQAKWYMYDPLSPTNFSASENQINLADADVIFSLESDFLSDRPDSLALIRAFSRRRNSEDGKSWNRLYVAESCPTITGAKADHRFALSPQDFNDLSAALLAGLQGTSSTDARWPWLSALIEDLRAHPGRSILLGGRSLSTEAQQALAAANAILGNNGKTMIDLPPSSEISAHGNLNELTDRMQKSEVATLLMISVNPVYDAPVDLPFARLLEKVPTSICHTFYTNETSEKCSWTIHATHDLEAWGDTQTLDGTLAITQPLIAPLYNGRSAIELLSLLSDGLEPVGYDLVRATWQTKTSLASDPFETEWRRWLSDGVMQLPAASLAPNNPSSVFNAPSPQMQTTANQPDPKSIWLCFRPGSATWDGRHANNGWLQELADPNTKLTWDNAALMSHTTAMQLKVKDGYILALQVGDAKIETPVLIIPGHADRCITLPLGYGRTVCGSVGKGVGFNAYLLRRSNSLWHAPLEKVECTGRVHQLARTQEHFRMEGRDLLRVSRIDEAPATPAPNPPPLPSLYPEVDYKGHKWAMSINLNTCVGCNACIVACQSENNIPVVGKEQVLKGREMQWIRVDRYYQGSAENPQTHFQPVPCMQCEKAPCEVVCPVAATQHDDEGLNVMVYNRCVGTRYCSNNCPYKVRRFNFLLFNDHISESQQLRMNPNVTIRSRGVMEKCTYCVQRIEEARIGARLQHRPLRGEDIVTSCQAACPAEAIVFGDLSDPESSVSKNRRKPGHYAMLEELDTQPRTTYLEKRINPNPALEPATQNHSSLHSA